VTGECFISDVDRRGKKRKGTEKTRFLVARYRQSPRRKGKGGSSLRVRAVGRGKTLSPRGKEASALNQGEGKKESDGPTLLFPRRGREGEEG